MKVKAAKSSVSMRLDTVDINTKKSDMWYDVQLWQEPIAFWGGAVVGALNLNLEEEPLKSWLASTSADAYVRALQLHCYPDSSCSIFI